MPFREYRRVFFMLLSWIAMAIPAQSQQFQAAIQQGLQEAKIRYRLTDRDIADWSVSDQYTNAKTGITYTYLQQQISGVRIFNAISTMAIRDGRVFHFANRFHSDALSKANSSTPAVSPETGILAAAAHLDISMTSKPEFQQKDDRGLIWTFAESGISRHPIQVELVYVEVENSFRLAWNVNIAPLNGSDWWNVRMDAHTGAFIEKNNWTVHCGFGHTHDAEGAPLRPAGKIIPGSMPEANNAAGGYQVFALPLEAPSFGARSLVTDPHSTSASPFGWHDNDGAAGAEFTITRGNNVYAYEDRGNNDQPGYSPDGGAALNFDFPLDLTKQPEVNQDAIITNLFYMNNMLHDILHHHGFDEVSGNFQDNTYGNGGEGGYLALAYGLDGGGTNNANFSSPPDGFSGTMQMYLWGGGGGAAELVVNSPATIAGIYNAVEASFGPALSNPITQDLVLVDDGTAPNPNDGCQTYLNSAAVSGKIAVVDRGNCPFIDKVSRAEAAGAVAVIVINNVSGSPISMGGTGGGSIGIPSVMISQADGVVLKNQISAGQTVNATLNAGGTGNVALDGSLDNGIVAHEYGHGLSIRLTGGPGNSGCLSNAEQGGEGWSDWLALLLTLEPGDDGKTARGIGSYALGQPTSGEGIRRYPYSTDMAVNPQTYADLAFSGQVHDIGEIWCQTLWDMTWKLIDAEGFDPDWFHGTGGNNTALKLVIEAMKLQPCGPGYLDARDAILAADDVLFNNAHRCLIWEAFAGRGMGFDARQGSANITGDEAAGMELPTYCQTAIVPPTADFEVDNAVSCFGFFQFTDKSTDIPQSWLWNFGDGNTSTAINPTHTYAVPGTYTVVLIVTNTLGSDIDTLTVTYYLPSAPVVSGPAAVCAGNTATLTAEVAPNYTAQWNLNNMPVFTGNSFSTPVLTETASYSVLQIEDRPVEKVGPPDNTFGGGSNHNTGFDGRLLFEAYAPFRLRSVLLYAQGAGPRTITLYDATNQVVQTVTVDVPNGANRVTLNIDVPAAGLYSLGNESQNLYRNNGGANYPYTIPNLVRIYSSNSSTSALGYYYYFYDWEVQGKGCVSPATTVTVEVLPGPVAGFTYTADKLTASFSDQSSGVPGSTWSWNFGDGAVSAEQNPSHTYSASGTYTVTLTVSNGSCSSTLSQEVTVSDQSTGTYDPNDPLGVRVFPNPVHRELNIQIQRVPAEPILVSLTDASGRECFSREFTGGHLITIETGSLASGTYKLRLAGNSGVVTKKVVVAR